MIRLSCRHYLTSRPCVFNKRDGSECPDCRHASDVTDRVLIVKLDAIGDVLRSASLLPAIRRRHRAPFIAWVTRPESVPLVAMMRDVDEVVPLTQTGLARIETGGWDAVYALSNDLDSASLAMLPRNGPPVIGYGIANGVVAPSNDAAWRWLEMAAFDRLKRANQDSYQALMMAIIGAAHEPLDRPALVIADALRAAAHNRLAALFAGSARRKVAVNMGSGGRWPKKMVDEHGIVAFIQALRGRADVDVVLVGGAAEAEKTEAVLAALGGDPRVRAALTETSIPAFVALLSHMDALLCGDTLALHIATALGLPTLAVFGPTSMAEIPTYGGLVEKVAADGLDCLVCYGDCDKPRHCMARLDMTRLAEMMLDRLAFPRPGPA